MRILRWMLGLIVIITLLYINFFMLEMDFIVKLINVILFCSAFVLYRVIIGPSSADRIVAVDILGILIIGLLALTGIWYDQSFFLDIGLIWALMSFIASLAYSKILEGRNLDD